MSTKIISSSMHREENLYQSLIWVKFTIIVSEVHFKRNEFFLCRFKHEANSYRNKAMNFLDIHYMHKAERKKYVKLKQEEEEESNLTFSLPVIGDQS